MAVRKALALVLVFAFILCVASPISFAACACGKVHAVGKPQPCSTTAAEGLCNNNAWKKLGRGVCNLLTFPLEIPNQISKTNITDGPMAAFTWGAIKGVGMTAFRALVGAYETISFPVPCPEGYAPILTDPEFFFEDQIC